jgi:hypothetical protein
MLKRRTLKAGPESRFLKRAFDSGLVQDDAHPRLILKELILPTGIPDAVVFYHSDIQLDRVPPRRSFSTIHLQIVAHLYDVGSATADELVVSLAIPRVCVETILRDLRDANLLTMRQGTAYRRSLNKVFAAHRIVAIEAKLQDWRKGLMQAAANFWFASHSYLLVPPLRCLDQILTEARKLGVGVLVFDENNTRSAARPKQIRLPASYGSWLIHEWAMRRFAQGTVA